MSNVTQINKKEFEILAKQVRVLLGGGVRTVEIKDEEMEVLLTVAIEEYSSFINDWLIQNQWSTLQNLQIDSADITFALTTKTLDFEKSFSFAYSKQAGIGTNSPWELKKDYIVVSANTQVYSIPAGREVNEVLWITPPQMGSAGSGILDTLSPVGWSFGSGGWNWLGNSLLSITPAFNSYLFTQDIKMKKNILQSELTYRITGGPNGTKNLYLYPIPGSRDEITGKYGKHYDGSVVWYFYYDTNEKDRDACLDANNDIIKLPNDVPIDNIPWQKLNTSSKTKVRRLLIAEAKNYVAQARGKFSGKIEGRNGKEVTMDYGFLLDQAEKEKSKIYDELREFLTKLTYRTMMEDKAAISESLNTVLKHTPTNDGGMQMH